MSSVVLLRIGSAERLPPFGAPPPNCERPGCRQGVSHGIRDWLERYRSELELSLLFRMEPSMSACCHATFAAWKTSAGRAWSSCHKMRIGRSPVWDT